jgi:hypothetical protein
MLWLSQNHNNHSAVYETSNKILYDVLMCNPNVIIIKNRDAVAPQDHYDNYVCVILMQLLFKNWDALALPKLS